MTKSFLNIALVQSDLSWMDVTSNLNHIESIVMSSLATNYKNQVEVDVWVLPEMFSTGFTMDVSGLDQKDTDVVISWMQSLAQSTNALITGSIAVKDNNGYWNRSYAVSADGVLSMYDKVQTFSLSGESDVYNHGDHTNVFTYKGWRIKPLICYDLRFPRLSSNPDLYDVLIYVANWPNTRITHWNKLLEARSIENQAYVIGVNRVGTDPNGFLYNGNSAAYGPMGTLIVEAQSSVEQIVVSNLSYDNLIAIRKQLPFIYDTKQV